MQAERPRYKVGSVVVAFTDGCNLGRIWRFVEVMGHTPTGAPQLRQLEKGFTFVCSNDTRRGRRVVPTQARPRTKTPGNDAIVAVWDPVQERWRFGNDPVVGYLDHVYDPGATYQELG